MMRTMRYASTTKWLFLTVLAWLLVMMTRLIDLGGEWHPVAVLTWATLLSWLVLYVLGFALAAAHARGNTKADQFPDIKWFRTWTVRLSIFAALGAAAIVYEFAIVRGYGFLTDVAAIRISEVNNSRDGFGGSWISGLGRLMTPALVPAWLIALLSVEKIGRKIWAALLICTLVVFYQQVTFEGGRFFLAALLLSCIVAMSLRNALARTTGPQRQRKRGGGLQRTVFIFFVAAIAIAFFGNVFVSRVTLIYPDLASGYDTFSSRFPLDVSSETMSRLQGDSPLWFIAYMFWIYSTHAINQFDVLIHHEGLVHSMGVLEFAQVSKAITIITGYNLSYDVFSNLPIAGTYTTFLGTAYIDFGLPVTLLMGLGLGVLTGSAAGKLNRGRFSSFGLSAPILIAISLFSPIHSLVLNLWPAIFWAYVAARKSGKTMTFPATPVSIKANDNRSLSPNG
jgi:hypothetical protein